jgi:hypothetical protein
MAFWCVSQQSMQRWFKNNMSKTFYKKVEEGRKFFPAIFFPSIFFVDFFGRVFFAVSLHESSKTPQNYFRKTEKKLKGTGRSQDRHVAFFCLLFFFSAPCFICFSSLDFGVPVAARRAICFMAYNMHWIAEMNCCTRPSYYTRVNRTTCSAQCLARPN